VVFAHRDLLTHEPSKVVGLQIGGGSLLTIDRLDPAPWPLT
jgi:hypothetical protein